MMRFLKELEKPEIKDAVLNESSKVATDGFSLPEMIIYLKLKVKNKAETPLMMVA